MTNDELRKIYEDSLAKRARLKAERRAQRHQAVEAATMPDLLVHRQTATAQG